MHKKLKWNAIGLVKKTSLLLEKIQEEKQNEPSEHTKIHSKLQGFLDELTYLLNTMKKIKDELIPELEQRFRLIFRTPEIIMLALSRPSIRNIYKDLRTHFAFISFNTLKPEDYKELAATGDAASVLALIGDSVLDLGIVQLLWDSSMSKVGNLSSNRASIVSNENLAKVCDKWKLFDYRLKRLNNPTEMNAEKETIEHKKATLVEAVYGVIYLEFGYDELLRTLPLIQ